MSEPGRGQSPLQGGIPYEQGPRRGGDRLASLTGRVPVDVFNRLPKAVWLTVPIVLFLSGVFILLGISGGGSTPKVLARTGTTLATTPSTLARTHPTQTPTTVAGTKTPSHGPPTVAISTPTTAPAPTGVVFKVTGTGTSTALSVTIVNGGQQKETRRVALPFLLTEPDTRGFYGLTAQSASPSTTGSLSCEIDQPGHAPVTKTTHGAYVVVTCIGTSVRG